MSSTTYYINNQPINIYNLYKYMINLYKLGIIPEFNVHFNNDLTEIIFLTEYNNTKWGINGTSIIMYNINTNKWRACINTLTKEELYIKYPHLYEKNLFVENTLIIEEYITFESYNIDDILEPALNPFDIKYLNVNNYNNNNLRNLYSINNQQIHNMYFNCYHGFINNVIIKEFNLDNSNNYGPGWSNFYNLGYSYLTYNNLINDYIY